MNLKLGSLKKSIEALNKSIQLIESEVQMNLLSIEVKETLKAGIIQNFEVAYEQSWKMMKRWLENNFGHSQIDGVTRRELFRLSAESKLINDVNEWMLFHQARNETSHTYDGEIVEDVLEVSARFLVEAKKLLQQLESHND